VVVDASLAVKWVLPEQHSDRAVGLLREWKAKRIQPVAPVLLAVEAANAIYKRVRRGELSPSEGKLALRTLLQTGVLFQGDQHLCPEAWDIAHQFDRPAVYDAMYLALAFTLGCELWTGDERLYNAVRGKLNWVRWVGELHPQD
jgi:predicted nucleic acid-binding protein